MGRFKTLGSTAKAKGDVMANLNKAAEPTVAIDAAGGVQAAKTAFTLKMTYNNGFMVTEDNQFKLLCPVQLVNGTKVTVHGVVPKEAKVG